MNRASICLLAVLTLIGGSTANASTSSSSSAFRIVLFGARWCAPCMAEYKQLPRLIEAAVPDRIVLAWTDKPMPVPERYAETVQSLSPEEASRLAAITLGEGYGLPTSAMMDDRGKVCALWKAPLHLRDIAHLRSKCRSHPAPAA